MSLTRNSQKQVFVAFSVTLLALGQACIAQSQSLRFQRPSQVRQEQVNNSFRSPADREEAKPLKARRAPERISSSSTNTSNRKPASRLSDAPPYSGSTTTVRVPKEVAQSLRELQRDSRVVTASVRTVQHVPELAKDEEIPTPPSDQGEDPMMIMPGEEYLLDQQFSGEDYGMPCDSCGSLVGCGCGVEPSCGCGSPHCGSCVGAPGPDYWCFPVCLPRFKDLTFWGGAHGFRGPRDFVDPNGVLGARSDSNFGFQTGVNISGRAPFIGLLFPQLSYQLGYQYVGSRFSGTVEDADDRSQSFVTAGFFRRVPCSGIQAGVVWDMVRDDLYFEDDFHQIRYEVSVKSPSGREFGIWGANSTNEKDILGTTYQAVDQFALFYRCNFGKSSSARAWAGFTEGDDGLVGAEFVTPLTDRWSINSGFNYRIPDENSGLAGVSEEAWNVGFNLSWHLGRTARNCARSPYRPMFSVADNGWLMVDRVE